MQFEETQLLSQQTSDSSAFLNAMCLLKYVLNYETAFSIFHISIRINCNRITEGLLFTVLSQRL
jgi:hypothetical protein